MSLYINGARFLLHRNSHSMRRVFSQLASPASSSARLLLHRTVPSRPFSATASCNSHVGSAPIAMPPGVTLEFPPTTPPTGIVRDPEDVKKLVVIKGPLGELSLTVPHYLDVQHDIDLNKVMVSVPDRKVKRQREMWGTMRGCLANHIRGVSEGHTSILRLVGVGYRAMIEKTAITKKPEYEGQQFVSLKVGFGHPVELGVPPGVKVTIPQPTRILLEGLEKEVVTGFAAKIRRWRAPEPYKGKGIFVDGETIKLKSKKIR